MPLRLLLSVVLRLGSLACRWSKADSGVRCCAPLHLYQLPLFLLALACLFAGWLACLLALACSLHAWAASTAGMSRRGVSGKWRCKTSPAAFIRHGVQACKPVGV
jgi:hypothetical protein